MISKKKKTVLVSLIIVGALVLLTAAFLLYGSLVFGWFHYTVYSEYGTYAEAIAELDKEALKAIPEQEGYDCSVQLYYNKKYGISDATGYESIYLIAKQGDNTADIWCSFGSSLTNMDGFDADAEKTTVGECEVFKSDKKGDTALFFEIDGNGYRILFKNSWSEDRVTEFCEAFISSVKNTAKA